MAEKRAVKEKHGKQSKFELLRCRRPNPPAAPYSNLSGTAAPLIILHPTQQHKFTPTTKRHRQDASCRCLFYVYGASLHLREEGRNPLNFLCTYHFRSYFYPFRPNPLLNFEKSNILFAKNRLHIFTRKQLYGGDGFFPQEHIFQKKMRGK